MLFFASLIITGMVIFVLLMVYAGAPGCYGPYPTDELARSYCWRDYGSGWLITVIFAEIAFGSALALKHITLRRYKKIV